MSLHSQQKAPISFRHSNPSNPTSYIPNQNKSDHHLSILLSLLTKFNTSYQLSQMRQCESISSSFLSHLSKIDERHRSYLKVRALVIGACCLMCLWQGDMPMLEEIMKEDEEVCAMVARREYIARMLLVRVVYLISKMRDFKNVQFGDTQPNHAEMKNLKCAEYVKQIQQTYRKFSKIKFKFNNNASNSTAGNKRSSQQFQSVENNSEMNESTVKNPQNYTSLNIAKNTSSTLNPNMTTSTFFRTSLIRSLYPQPQPPNPHPNANQFYDPRLWQQFPMLEILVYQYILLVQRLAQYDQVRATFIYKRGLLIAKRLLGPQHRFTVMLRQVTRIRRNVNRMVKDQKVYEEGIFNIQQGSEMQQSRKDNPSSLGKNTTKTTFKSSHRSQKKSKNKRLLKKTQHENARNFQQTTSNNFKKTFKMFSQKFKPSRKNTDTDADVEVDNPNLTQLKKSKSLINNRNKYQSDFQHNNGRMTMISSVYGNGHLPSYNKGIKNRTLYNANNQKYRSGLWLVNTYMRGRDRSNNDKVIQEENEEDTMRTDAQANDPKDKQTFKHKNIKFNTKKSKKMTLKDLQQDQSIIQKSMDQKFSKMQQSKQQDSFFKQRQRQKIRIGQIINQQKKIKDSQQRLKRMLEEKLRIEKKMQEARERLQQRDTKLGNRNQKGQIQLLGDNSLQQIEQAAKQSTLEVKQSLQLPQSSNPQIRNPQLPVRQSINVACQTDPPESEIKKNPLQQDQSDWNCQIM